MAGALDIALVQTRTPATARGGLDHVAPLIREAAAGGALGPSVEPTEPDDKLS